MTFLYESVWRSFQSRYSLALSYFAKEYWRKMLMKLTTGNSTFIRRDALDRQQPQCRRVRDLSERRATTGFQGRHFRDFYD